MLYIWLGVMLFALLIEASTTMLVSIWFALGALVSMICELLGGGLPLQIVLFVVVSGASLTLFLTKFRKKILGKRQKTNIDAVIGSVGKVEEAIPCDGVGRVNVCSQSWSAKSEDGTEIAVGERVEVLEVQGVKLICRKTERRA